MATGEQNKLNAIKGIARLVSCSAEEKTNLANETIPKNVVVKVDDENDVYIGDGVSSLSILSPFKPSTAGNADSANEFTENQTIELRGDIAGTASSKAGWTIDAALNETGVIAGTYGLDKDTVGNNNTIINIPQITVNEKGLVTLITTHTLQTVNTTTDPHEVSADEAIEGVSVQAGVISAATLESKINDSFTKYEASSDDINNLFIDNYEGKNYSIIIDFSLSDPASMITYADDVDIAPMDTRWFDELGLKLCVLKNGVVQYYLNPDDVTKKLDGSAADITTLGNDVMLEIPRMGTNCMWLDGNRLKITITTAPNSAEYDYRAFSLHKYNDCDKIYIGRYHACLDNNKMYSSSGKTPMVEQTLADHRTYATNRGVGYTDIGICDDILLQCLYLLIVRNFNSQSAVGRGICDTFDDKHDTGEANTFGWLNTGSPDKTDGDTAVCCLGIENFWGNIFVWEDGIIRNSNRQFFMAQYADQYNSDATGYEYIAQASPTAGGYQGRCAGIPKFIFMPDASTVAASGRGESTYMCDIQWINESITVIAAFGGSWSDGSGVGAFDRNLDSPAPDTFSTVGSRLCFKKIAEN